MLRRRARTEGGGRESRKSRESRESEWAALRAWTLGVEIADVFRFMRLFVVVRILGVVEVVMADIVVVIAGFL
jgi:hypothetical protein